MKDLESLIYALIDIAFAWTFLSSAIESGIKHGIKKAMKDVTIKVNTYDHR